MGRTAAKASHNPLFFRYLQLLAARITSLRKRNGLSMEELGAACGVTRGTIHKIEHPEANEDLSLGTLWALARHFDVALDELLQGLSRAAEVGGNDAFSDTSRWLQPEDHLALALVAEVTALQIRADLAEQACLVAKDEHQLEKLAEHSAKLRQRRYSLLLRQRGES